MENCIYHYTSIKNLALILKSRKIRFNRLDRVDDLKEIEELPRKFGTYVYVSCWTEDEIENIPLWKMYTENMNGVRIAFPKSMFKKNVINANEYKNVFGYNGLYQFEDFESPLSIKEILNEKYCIVNQFWHTEYLDFLKKITYDDNYPKSNEKILVENLSGGTILNAHLGLGRYKKEIWRFQNECRFILIVYPLVSQNEIDIRPDYFNAIKNDVENKMEHIDLKLDEDIIDNILLRLGPLCDESDEVIIDSLLKKYTKNGKLEQSNLDGVFRKK